MKLISIVLSLLGGLDVFGQSVISLDLHIPNSYNQKSISTVLCMLQDQKGYLWMGTISGLFKYDGYTFQQFKTKINDSNSISDNIIQCITQDNDGFLWIGTRNGLNRFNPEYCVFKRFYHQKGVTQSISNNHITSIIYRSSENSLFIGTGGGGLNVYNLDRKTFTVYKNSPKDPHSLSNDYINCLFETDDGNIWIGTSEGISKKNKGKSDFHVYKYNQKQLKSISNNEINSIIQEQTGNIWIGTANGLFRYDAIKDEFIRFGFPQTDAANRNRNIIYRIYNDHDNNLWVGGYSGLFLFDKKKEIFYSVSSKNDKELLLNKGTVSLIYEDRLNNIYFSFTDGLPFITYNQNMAKFKLFNKTTFINHTLSSNVIRAFYEQRNNKLWIGTNEGVNVLDWNTLSIDYYKMKMNNKNSLCFNSILSLSGIGEDTVIIGTAGRGFNIFDTRKKIFSHYFSDTKRGTKKISEVLNNKNPSGNHIYCMLPDGNHSVWFGTNNGLNQWDITYDHFIHYISNSKDSTTLSNNTVMSLALDRNSLLWIGTIKGLNKLDIEQNKITNYKNDSCLKPFENTSIRSLYIDESDSARILWIGSKSGLIKYDLKMNSIKYFAEYDELYDFVVYGILPDKKNNLWLSTDKGICVFHPLKEHFKFYSTQDGLQSNDFNFNAYNKLNNGEFIFGGNNGFNKFHPDSIKDNPHIPPIVLTSFKKFNREIKLENDINYMDELVLNYDDYVFSFEYAALNYTNPEKNQYAYWMEGFEKDWTYCGTRRYVSYTNLDPGNYVFHVKGSNNDGVWNETGKSLKIIITPPYYQTWWFRTLMVIFAGLVVVFIVQWRKYYKEYRRLRYISHFKIVRKIGEGGMGEVFHAKNFITGDSVALKLLHPKLTAEESTKTRFLREAKLMSDLQHPNIVKIFETGEAAGRGYISMELLEGMTLSEFIKKSGYLSSSIAVDITLSACEALSFIHQQGVIHRDIKSENIFILQPQSKSKSRFRSLSKISQTRLTWPERVRLMDFGLAKSLELMTITQVESIIGTIAYMSPEQASGRSVDQRSDVYSLGVVMYEALTGHLPHESDNELVVLQAVMDGRDPKPMESYGVEIPDTIRNIVMKMLKKYPDERIQSIEEVKDALRSFKGTDKGQPTVPVKTNPSPKSLSRQSMVYLSKGEVSKALEASQSAIENIKDVSGHDDAEVYFNHYKVLSRAGKIEEAKTYMTKALSRVTEGSVLEASPSGDKRILVEYNTQRWKQHYESALEFQQTGNISEARLELLDAIALIKQSLLIIDDDKEKSYYTEANNVNDVIQLMHQLMN